MRCYTRRDFLAVSGAALAASVAPSVDPAATAGAADAESVYRRSLVLDCNTLASIGLQLDDGTEGKANLKILRESGVDTVKCTLGGFNADFEQTVADIAAAQALLERHPDTFLKVGGVADIDRAKRDGKTGVIFSFEGVAMLADRLDRIDLFRQLGVRVMQLSYNHRSGFGAGCLDGEEAGLTELGRQAIARMNAGGVALDLSHSNARTTAEGIAASARPALVTHAGCRAVHPHPRNKQDRDLRALADKGGVVGIYMLPYLTEETRQPSLADYLAHLTHALQVCGEDHVGIGSDVPFFVVTDDDLAEMRKDVQRRQAAGISAPGENRPAYIPDLNTPRKLERVAAALLRQGYGERVVEKVLGANFRRAFQDIWSIPAIAPG